MFNNNGVDGFVGNDQYLSMTNSVCYFNDCNISQVNDGNVGNISNNCSEFQYLGFTDNPMYIDFETFELHPNSPLIDSGIGDSDECFPPSMGTSSTDALEINVLNGNSNKTCESVEFKTKTAGTAADHGKFTFLVDDIAILDIKMPRLDGLEVLQKLRNSSDIPVIFLTSKDDEIDQLLGLKMGADDYITKPFSQKLLIERVKVILKRTSFSSIENTVNSDSFIERGNLILNMDRHECHWKEERIKLTVTEFLLLESLVNRPGYVKNRDQLMSAAYSDDLYVDDRTIDSHIKRIRRKFKAIDKNFNSIETLYGVGYRFNQ